MFLVIREGEKKIIKFKFFSGLNHIARNDEIFFGL